MTGHHKATSLELAGRPVVALSQQKYHSIPTNGDKKATISWKEFQTRMMTTSEALILKKKPMNVIRTRYKVAICQGAWICNCIFNYIHPATVQNRA